MLYTNQAILDAEHLEGDTVIHLFETKWQRPFQDMAWSMFLLFYLYPKITSINVIGKKKKKKKNLMDTQGSLNQFLYDQIVPFGKVHWKKQSGSGQPDAIKIYII
jgi:hypothetical protein